VDSIDVQISGLGESRATIKPWIPEGNQLKTLQFYLSGGVNSTTCREVTA